MGKRSVMKRQWVHLYSVSASLAFSMIWLINRGILSFSFDWFQQKPTLKNELESSTWINLTSGFSMVLLHEAIIQKMEENGIEVYEWTEQDAADLLEVATPVVEGFLDQLEAGGLPAWDVYEHLLEARDSLR